MISRTFIWDDDHEHGTTGWKPKGMPDFNVGTGMTVAHDVLEHFSYTDASLEGEMMAFGSSLFIRHEGCYWGNKGAYHTDYHYHVSGEIAMFLQNNGLYIRKPPKTRKLDSELEDELTLVRQRVIKAFPDYDIDINEGIEPLDRALDWIRRGYRKAVRRFKGCSPFYVCSLFMDIEREVDTRFKHGEFGDELKISFSPSTLKHKITRISEAEFW